MTVYFLLSNIYQLQYSDYFLYFSEESYTELRLKYLVSREISLLEDSVRILLFNGRIYNYQTYPGKKQCPYTPEQCRLITFPKKHNDSTSTSTLSGLPGIESYKTQCWNCKGKARDPCNKHHGSTLLCGNLN